ncbi:MAG: hypothetical protein M1812_005968 [Candelaria pacifica]|nr:MAG: hypothetical protein M1812_005968 [Candelaria pacifica]
MNHKIWFSDEPNVGRLIFARFDSERGAIEGYRLVASVGHRTFSRWEWDQDVGIHSFNPVVKLWLDQPIVKLSGEAGRGSFRQDVRMDLGMEDNGIFSELSLARAIAPERIDPRMDLWPPQIIPANDRVRKTSHDAFKGRAHRPDRLNEICDGAFRIKKWMEFRANLGVPFGVRMGEEVSIYSTLPEDTYTATPDKPWNGIWVGDYSGHGCEFLLILHFDNGDGSLSPSSSSDTPDEFIETHETGTAAAQGQKEGLGRLAAEAETIEFRDGGLEQKQEYVPSGALRAIKLTGDPNVPRGEYSFISDDIGAGGLIRVAEEEIFRGARIVGSRGHIAGHGFRNDKYISSQLIMISPNRLAQYWEDFGHISYYERVDVDEIVRSH